MDKEENIELPIDTDINYNANKFIDIACAFTKFVYIHCLKPDGDKWHVKINRWGGIAEMTNSQLFHYFMKKTEGDKSIWK